MQKERHYTLALSCPDRVGIVASVSGFIADHGGWILESDQHADTNTGRYFMRIEIKAASLPFDLSELCERFSPVADNFDMEWKISDSAKRKRVIIMVSNEEHCLYDLLGRYASQELDIEVPCIISNHDHFKGLVEWHGIRFHHIPFEEDDKAKAYEQIEALWEEAKPEAIVLARFMRIIPPDLCQQYAGQILNIHHSFLPSFPGARPYHQAHARGVKQIGATCHYVTADLDQGPIIDQDVIRIEHGDSPDQLVRFGKDIEKAVLARGVRYHLEDRVFVNGKKTVVFR